MSLEPTKSLMKNAPTGKNGDQKLGKILWLWVSHFGEKHNQNIFRVFDHNLLPVGAFFTKLFVGSRDISLGLIIISEVR